VRQMYHELRKEGTNVTSPEILPKTLPRTSFKTASWQSLTASMPQA
jgi:hypothetical protein